MNPYLRFIEVGTSLPFDNPHAVSVSLPTLNDVIGYEENHARVIDKMQSGYPRFFINPFITQLMQWVRKEHRVDDSIEMIPVMDHKAIELVKSKFLFISHFIQVEDCCFLCVEKSKDQLGLIKDYIRQAGLFLSSRKAESALVKLDLLAHCFQEESSQKGYSELVSHLENAYNANGSGHVFLTSCGMNAIFAVLETVLSANGNTQKSNILQVGCLYVDSDQLIKRVNSNKMLEQVKFDINQIRDILHNQHGNIAAVFTEFPNNPLIDCPDLVALYELCKNYTIPLIVDATFCTPHNANVLPYCDVAIESLTKFACGRGDSIMGAVIANPKSNWSFYLNNHIGEYIIAPFYRDVNRLADGISNYEMRMKIVSENTHQLIAYLEQSPAIERVFSVLSEPGYGYFQQIQKYPGALPGLVSITFKGDIQFWYDKLNLPKGPSLGTSFTLAMPYVYMAHYHLLKTSKGMAQLQRMGIPAGLLRISVGLEPISEIIEVFKSAGI